MKYARQGFRSTVHDKKQREVSVYTGGEASPLRKKGSIVEEGQQQTVVCKPNQYLVSAPSNGRKGPQSSCFGHTDRGLHYRGQWEVGDGRKVN